MANYCILSTVVKKIDITLKLKGYKFKLTYTHKRNDYKITWPTHWLINVEPEQYKIEACNLHATFVPLIYSAKRILQNSHFKVMLSQFFEIQNDQWKCPS